MNGSAAIHDVELALEGKTSEDVGTMLNDGKFGMARETADFFALATRRGADEGIGLGAKLAFCLQPVKLVSLAPFMSLWAPISFICIPM
jgi:hypothetical protein